VTERGRLLPGGVFNEEAATSPEATELKASLVALSHLTEIICFTGAQLALVTGGRTIKRTSAVVAPGTLRSLSFNDLELHRIIGTGQFGAVRLVRSKVSNEVFALKVRNRQHRVIKEREMGGSGRHTLG
jgi:cGMP-dependent protein kinase